MTTYPWPIMILRSIFLLEISLFLEIMVISFFIKLDAMLLLVHVYAGRPMDIFILFFNLVAEVPSGPLFFGGRSLRLFYLFWFYFYAGNLHTVYS